MTGRGAAGAGAGAEGLVLKGVTVQRGGLPVCRDVSLAAPPGEITVLLGANGAGKSTLLDGVSGVLPLAAGEIRYRGHRIDRLPLHRRARLGIAYVDQGRSVFSRLTVAENLAVVDGSREALERAVELFPRLGLRRDVRAGRLSGGEQQMLLIARALAARPGFLVVDELSLGLGPRVVDELVGALVSLAERGLGVLLVEQFVETALGVGATGHVMRRGRIVRSAPCAELLRDRAALVSPYLVD